MHFSAASVIGDDVKNGSNEYLGKIEDLLVDTHSCTVKYAILSFGGFLGMNNLLFAVPIETLTFDPSNNCFRMSARKDRLESAPGFDKDIWPDTTDLEWQKSISAHYGTL